MRDEQLSNPFDDRAHLRRGRLVAKANEMMKPEFVTRRQGFYADVRNLTVRHADDGSIERADPSRSKADVVHGSRCLAKLQEVAHTHGLVEDERQPTDDVFE